MKTRMVLVVTMILLAFALAGVPAASARILECEDSGQAGQVCPPQLAGESK
jgi:hypothetical protein